MSTHRTRLLGFGLITALGATVVSHGVVGAQTNKKVFVDLRMFSAGAPAHIDPRIGGGSEVAILVFDSLTDTDANGKTVPAAAVAWKTLDSGKSWVFTLKKEAKFSNGELVTPTHFARSWITTGSSAFASETAYPMFIIDGFEAWNSGKGPKPTSVTADDAKNTLTVKLKEPFLGFPEMASHPVFSPMIKANWDAPNTLETDATRLVGNGPFRYARTPKLAAGGQIDLVSNERFGPKAGNLTEIQLKISADEAGAYNLFQSGQGDAASIPGGLFKVATATYGDRGTGTAFGTDFWGFNMTDPVVGGAKNQKLRLAIAKAIDRTQVSQSIYQGQRKPTDQLVPTGVPGYRTGLGLGVNRDLAGAKKAFGEWKAAGGVLSSPLRLSFDEGSNWDKVATIFVGNLKEAGIDAKLDPYSSDGSYFAKMKEGKGQIYRAGWFADYVLYDNFLFPLLHKSAIGGDNYGRYSSTEFSSLVDKARATADPTAAGNLYASAEKVALSQDVALLPVTNRANNAVFTKRVFEAKFNPLGYLLYDQIRVQ